MALTTYQKSIYLMVFDTTMILRSVGKTLKNKELLKKFKIETFRKIIGLIKKMDEGELHEKDILNSMETICKEFGVSFGQSQKAINVILKYHLFLTGKSNEIKKILHCPLDSVILNKLGMKISLAKMDRKTYIEMQNRIEEFSPTKMKIDFDKEWDEQYLKRSGVYDAE